MSETHQGSCLCGAVRFEITGAFDAFFLCHCSRCRKGAGSAHGANLFSSSAQIEWLSGADKIKTYRVPDSRHSRSFCGECGSMTPSVAHDGALKLVPAGSLDTPLSVRPNAHIHNSSRADWDHHLDDVPGFDGLPS